MDNQTCELRRRIARSCMGSLWKTETKKRKMFVTRHHVINHELQRRTGVSDIIMRIATMKWNWAGHVARQRDERCTKRLLTSVIERKSTHTLDRRPKKDCKQLDQGTKIRKSQKRQKWSLRYEEGLCSAMDVKGWLMMMYHILSFELFSKVPKTVSTDFILSMCSSS